MADKKVRYLNPIDIETKAERYCRFRKKGIIHRLQGRRLPVDVVQPSRQDFASSLDRHQLEVPAQSSTGHQKGPSLGVDALRC